MSAYLKGDGTLTVAEFGGRKGLAFILR